MAKPKLERRIELTEENREKYLPEKSNDIFISYSARLRLPMEEVLGFLYDVECQNFLDAIPPGAFEGRSDRKQSKRLDKLLVSGLDEGEFIKYRAFLIGEIDYALQEFKTNSGFLGYREPEKELKALRDTAVARTITSIVKQKFIARLNKVHPAERAIVNPVGNGRRNGKRR